MLKRKIINKLEAWKGTIANKTLFIKGARQVGKQLWCVNLRRPQRGI